MTSEFIDRGREYKVPCLYKIEGREKIVCIIVHGFGSSKESVTANMMFQELPVRGIGAFAFDFPAHGDSEVEGEYLLVSNCVKDLADAEARARELAPEAEIVFLASSFGALVTLIYLSGLKKGKPRAFLRSAAVSMPRLFRERQTPEQNASLKAAGEFIRDKAAYGYIRDLKITQNFIDDLESCDVFTLWREAYAKLCMIHGELDETIPLGDAGSFAGKFNVPLTVVPGGDHQLSIPGAPERVLKLALEFFA